MIFWFKARRVSTVLTGALLLFTIFAVLTGDVFVGLPSVAGVARVALSFFVPVPLVAGLTLCLESRLIAAESTAVRSVVPRDTVLIVATMLTATVISQLVHQFTHAASVDTVGRNTVFLTGLMLCSRALSSGAAAFVPTAWTITVVAIGFRTTGDPYPWTIIAEPAGALHAAAGSILMFAVGALALLYTSRKTS